MELQKILPVIEKKYNLGNITSCEFIHDGIDNKVYKITVENKKIFIIRENKRDFINKNPEFEIELIKKLNSLNFNTPRLILAKNGKAKIKIDESVFLVFEYISGKQFKKVDKEMISTGLVEMGGQILGKLHKETISFNLKNNPVRDIFTEFRRFRETNQEKLSKFEGYNEMAPYIDLFVKESKKRISSGLPSGIIHNDYYPGNLICKDNKNCYLIDFDWSCRGPFIKDVALGVSSWASSFDGKEPPNQEIIKKFLFGYNSVSPVKIHYNNNLLFWICFALLSETATFFVDVLESKWPDLNITKINQCYSYRKFEHFFKECNSI